MLKKRTEFSSSVGCFSKPFQCHIICFIGAYFFPFTVNQPLTPTTAEKVRKRTLRPEEEVSQFFVLKLIF
ncbi:MAG: hypothetical protein Ct9H300mP21_05360 [Pseudomonadota bacterium]|nr:MAG: hypothetical protein Ct9H300mP21_05360 [Pseudomonadota bacterium]